MTLALLGSRLTAYFPKKSIKINTAEQGDVIFFYSAHFSSFSACTVESLEVIYQTSSSSIWSHRSLCTTVSHEIITLAPCKTCAQTLMCKFGRFFCFQEKSKAETFQATLSFADFPSNISSSLNCINRLLVAALKHI